MPTTMSSSASVSSDSHSPPSLPTPPSAYEHGEAGEGSSSTNPPIRDSFGSLHSDPAVIVGMACRVPGATNPSQLWRALEEKRDLQRKIPTDRFNVDAFYHPKGSNKGTTATKYGYFLDQDLGLFDNDFFRISGREAQAMDPQQRILLEVVYEALEDAGITLDTIKGTNTSVFAGSFSSDYKSMATDFLDYPQHAAIGAADAILSNRVSYFYDLNGPSMTINTACSSSLVCFHLGNQSIQRGESDISIIAGSALHFNPYYFVTMTDMGMLSSDGRCRTYDAAGSGYVRGEGVCAVILKRQSLAESSGDPIRAVVRATGSNHDGFKRGLTVPSADAQARLIRQTYKDAGISPADTHYFEAHGTGTRVGDPIEAKAIGSVFAPGRDHPLIVGSIKSNIGHLEGASGLAGLIKSALTVEAGKILPNMHFTTPNPAIPFDELKIKVPITAMDWHASVRRASVNSFGYGGSNAHVILENYRQRRTVGFQSREGYEQPADERRPYLLPLATHNEQAGKNTASSLVKYLSDNSDIAIRDLARTYDSRRTQHKYRSFAVASTVDGLVRELSNPRPVSQWTHAPANVPKLGFVFTGQGAQWHAMGRQLIETMPLFCQVLQRCDLVLRALPDGPDWNCTEELLRSAEESQLSQSRFSQPLCTAVQLGILEILSAWGIKPHAMVGHSSGEIAAAYSAGVLSFDNAIICAYYRGLYMSKQLNDKNSIAGAMIAVGLTEREGRARIEEYQGRIALAAINSPSSLTLSGDEDAVLELRQALDVEKIFARQLKVEQAFHSHHMLPLAPGFERALSQIPTFRSSSPQQKFISSVTARAAAMSTMEESYWARNMTSVVRFSEAFTEMVLNEDDEQDVDLLVEIGPHPALKGPTKQILKSLNLDIPYFASLSRDVPAYESLLSLAGQLFQHEYPLDLSAVNSTLAYDVNNKISKTITGTRLSGIPTYAWDHVRHWHETRPEREFRMRPHRHSILGSLIPTAHKSRPQWRNYLRLNELSWLTQHVIDSKIIFPGAGYICMALEAIAASKPSFKKIMLQDIVFKSALLLSGAESGTEVILELQPQVLSAKSTSNTWRRFTVFSFDDADNAIEHCCGLICAEEGTPAMVGQLGPGSSFEETGNTTDQQRPPALYYKRLKKLGLDYGEDFQLITGDIGTGPGFSVAGLRYQPNKVISVPEDACLLHPTLLDSSFHTIFGALETLLDRPLDEPFVPTFIRSMSISGHLAELKHNPLPQNYWVKSNTTLRGLRVARSHLSIQSDRSTDVLVEIEGLDATALGNDTESQAAKRSLFFRTKWKPAFNCLGTTGLPEDICDVGSLVDIFAHQFPAANILYVTHSLERVRNILSRLGGIDSASRRLKSITPYLYAPDAEAASRFEADFPDLLDLSDPREGRFDIALISKDSNCNSVGRFVKDGGFIASEGTPFDGSGLTEVLETRELKIWQKISSFSDKAKETLTLLIPDQPSQRVNAVLSGIASTYNGPVVTHTIAELPEHLSTGPIVSLLSLDHDLFFDSTLPEQDQYQAIQKLLCSAPGKILWLLCGATHECANPAQAMILGLARVARSENADLRLVTFDLPAEAAAYEISRCTIQLLQAHVGVDEVALRNSILSIPRIVQDEDLNRKLPNSGNRKAQLEAFHQDRKLTLKLGKTGLIDTLYFDEDDRFVTDDLGDDWVEIEVKASSINFRDIAVALGMIDEQGLGSEGSGVIVRTGRNVAAGKLKPGDRVLFWASAHGAHGAFARTEAIFCVKIDDMDFATAATLGIVGATAYYSLIDVARSQPGEYCLIHSAAGGVGQLAIQIAQMLGAKVLATVGSESKRTLLKERFGLTDDAIFSSRDTSFVGGVLKATDGRGCDVALNSLAGPLLIATWKIIAPFGRMVEIGKRDIHENFKLDMEPFRKNITYTAVDLDTMSRVNKPLLGRLLKDIFHLASTERVKPPYPITKMAFSSVQQAFRLLQMGKITGKVVLVPGDGDMVPVMPQSFRSHRLFDAKKTYLVVGGLGGLGRNLSQWMFRRGARRLAFLSRSGTEKTESQAVVDWLRKRNVEVTVFKGDVADYATVLNCVKSVGSSLSGIIQAAMVLRDAPLEIMSFDQWRAATNPKVRGAYNLHQATLTHRLDFFVTFSSSQAIIGAKGQANYCAANCYLDALMQSRRASGLVGTTLNIGPVMGVGAVAEDTQLEKTMERLGYDMINEDELFYQIGEGISSSPLSTAQTDEVDSHQIITGINVRNSDVYWANKPMLSNLYAHLDNIDPSMVSKTRQNITVAIQNAKDMHERRSLLASAFIEKVADVLSVSVSTIKPNNQLSDYGLDSIIAVEFRTWFSKTTGVDVPVFDILGAKSIEALVEKVASAIQVKDASTLQTQQLNYNSRVQAESSQRSATTDEYYSKAKLSTPETSLRRIHGAGMPEKIPQSPYQKRLWSTHLTLEDKSALNFVWLLKLHGQPQPSLLQKVIEEFIYRNDALRTKYFDGPEFSEQAVSTTVVPKFQYVDLSGEPVPQQALNTWALAMQRTALDIENGENLSTALAKLSDKNYSWILAFHHISMDNGSAKSALDQLTSLYDAFSRGTDSSIIPKPSVTYSDFSLWYQDALRGTELQASIQWWQEELKDAPQSSALLPFALSARPAKASDRRGVIRTALPPSKLNRMKRICSTFNATPFHFFVAAWRAFFYRFTNEPDWVLLTMNGSRPHHELEDVIGFFVNVVPLRFQKPCDGTIQDLLEETKTITLNALAHGQVPFDVVLDACHIERTPSHHPLGQVFVNYKVNRSASKYQTDDFIIEETRVEDMPTTGELAIEVIEDEKDGLQLRLEFDSVLYNEQQMEGFLASFLEFLLNVIADFRAPVVDFEIPLLTI